jgi:hypothetical protein
MALRAQFLYQTAVQSICVSTAVTHPSEAIIDFLHVFSLLKRITLLVVGIVLLAANGTPCSPGVALPEFSDSEWKTVTHTDWVNSMLPGGQTIAMPGGTLWPGLWILTVATLIIYDTLRCSLVASSRWNRHDNQIDMTWQIMAYVPLPLVFIATSITLGHKDILILLSIVSLVFLSSVCGTLVDHVRICVNPSTIPGMSVGVVSLLRGMQDVSLLVASQLVSLPIMANFFNTSSDYPTMTQIVTFSLHTCLVLCLTIINHNNNRLCTIFENRWPDNRSVSEWDMNRRTKKNTEKTSVYGEYELKDQKQDDHRDDNTSYKGLDHTRSETDTDVVRIVDGDKRITTIKLTEDFHNIYRVGSSRSRTNDLSPDNNHTGMHVTRVGTHPHQSASEYVNWNSHGGPEDRHKMRQKTGILMEWRRYYLINILINALLLADILSITGVSEVTCSSSYIF